MQLVFTNNDDMLHNLVVGLVVLLFRWANGNEIRTKGQEKNYILRPKVLTHHYPPASHKRNYFLVAPDKPGEIYFCLHNSGHFLPCKERSKL